MLRGGWRSNAQQTRVTVFGPDPYSEAARIIDALYGLNLAGRVAPIDLRPNRDSAFSGARYNGDLGPLQDFAGSLTSPSPFEIKPGLGSQLPATAPASGNTMLDLLGQGGL